MIGKIIVKLKFRKNSIRSPNKNKNINQSRNKNRNVVLNIELSLHFIKFFYFSVFDVYRLIKNTFYSQLEVHLIVELKAQLIVELKVPLIVELKVPSIV